MIIYNFRNYYRKKMHNEQNLEETKISTLETGAVHDYINFSNEKNHTISSFSNQKIKNKKKKSKLLFDSYNSFKGIKHKNNNRYFAQSLS